MERGGKNEGSRIESLSAFCEQNCTGPRWCKNGGTLAPQN